MPFSASFAPRTSLSNVEGEWAVKKFNWREAIGIFIHPEKGKQKFCAEIRDYGTGRNGCLKPASGDPLRL
jgi:hypothetical protein